MSVKKVRLFTMIVITFIGVLFYIINSNAYNLDLISTNGKKANVADFKGKIVVITFFDQDCYFCQKEVPTLNKLYLRFGKNQKSVVIIGVDPFDHLEQIREFASEFGAQYPLYWGNYAQTAPLGGIFATPTSIFINKQGTPKVRVPGQISEQDFVEIIKSIE